MYEWILANGYEPIIIATKLDKIKRSQVSKNVKVIRDTLKCRPGTLIIPFSAESKQGRDEIYNTIDNLLNDEG
jgi:GTP-binding protein